VREQQRQANRCLGNRATATGATTARQGPLLSRMESGSRHRLIAGCPGAHADVRRLIDRVSVGVRKRRSVRQLLDLAIVAHCVDVDPQKIPDSSRDSEGSRFRTGRDQGRQTSC